MLMKDKYGWLLWEESADNAEGGDTDDTDDTETPPETPEGFEAWLAEQDDDVKAQYDKHIHGLKSALTKEREAAKSVASLTKKLKVFEDADEATRRKDQTEMENLREDLKTAQGDVTAANSVLKKERINFAITSEAAEQDFEDPSDALRLLDVSKLEIDEAGKIKGITKLLKKLAEDKPYLLKSSSNSSRIGTPPKKRKTKTDDSKQERRRPTVAF